MKIRDGKQDVYENWKKDNTDFYGAGVLRFGEVWADLMEAELLKGARLEDIAGPCSVRADDIGITGYMYGASVSFLSSVWEHGEELRRWHNKANTLSDEDLLMLENIQTEEGWGNACSEIKKWNGGVYPSDWFEKVIKSGLIGRVCARFGETGEVHIVPMSGSFRGGGL